MKPLVKQNTRFNLFDAAICLVALAFVVGLVFYLLPHAQQGEEALVEVTVTGMRADLAALLQEGELLYDQSGNTELGTLSDVTVHRDTLVLTDAVSGEERRALYPENTLCAVRFTLRIPNARVVEDGVRVGSVEIRPKAPLSLRSARVALTGTAELLEIKGGAA